MIMSHVTSLPNFVCSHSRYKEAAVACFVIVEKNQVWLHCSHLVCAVAPKQLKLDILDLKEIFSMIEVMFSFVSPHCFISAAVLLCSYLHFIPHRGCFYCQLFRKGSSVLLL